MYSPHPQTSYLDPRFDSQSHLTPSTTVYQLEDEGVQPADEEEPGDIPLLSIRQNYGEDYEEGRVPGAYEPSLDGATEVNIHYGRIPQRVPRRFKTTKRIQ